MLSRREMALGAAALTASVVSAKWSPRDRAALIPFDRELRPFVAQFLDRPPPDLTAANLSRYRVLEAAGAAPALPAPPVTRVAAAGLNGAPDVGLVIVNARRRATRPAILYLHGGGFVIGTAAGAVRQLQELAASLDCVGIAVDYRLAPETRHDGILDDCAAALGWVRSQAATIGVDSSRIAIMGASAGGGLAALLALRARDDGLIRPCLQLLVYPMLDDRTVDSPGAPVSLWSVANNRFGWSSFLGPDASEQAVPARRRDLAGLPPTFIAVGSADLFLGEDVAFARRLALAHVPVTLKVIPGAFHGFDLAVPQAWVSRQLRWEIEQILSRAFAGG